MLESVTDCLDVTSFLAIFGRKIQSVLFRQLRQWRKMLKKGFSFIFGNKEILNFGKYEILQVFKPKTCFILS